MPSKARIAHAKDKAASPLRASTLPQTQLVLIGARYNLEQLSAHATTVTAKVTAQNADAKAKTHFADYGLGAAWVGAMKALQEEIAADATSQSDLAANALPAATEYRAAAMAVKALRAEGLTVLAADPTYTAPRTALGSGSSVTAIRHSLLAVAKAMPTTATTPVGTGEAFRTKAKAAVQALDAAKSAYREALAALSPATLRVHAAKGILQKELKSAARVAKTVSTSDAKLYSVERHARIHKRSLKHAATKTPAAPATTSPTPATSKIEPKPV